MKLTVTSANSTCRNTNSTLGYSGVALLVELLVLRRVATALYSGEWTILLNPERRTTIDAGVPETESCSQSIHVSSLLAQRAALFSAEDDVACGRSAVQDFIAQADTPPLSRLILLRLIKGTRFVQCLYRCLGVFCVAGVKMRSRLRRPCLRFVAKDH
ncbi:hypothetical protein Poly21_28560 [Allorhodopirellula heiligendammensis]|uniref:Uncharacterized protein n=1 Tax=Allorhodopirellula heiligendammensis TaxID=2714739 RepID=A0A5C6BYG8_9BACT|nr:hypothetical protein Poly21_28560 [Allorhodopirellula heiligendammensis]